MSGLLAGLAPAVLGLAVLAVPFPIVVALAALVGWLLGRFAPHTLRAGPGHANAPARTGPLIADDALHAERPSHGRLMRILGVGSRCGSRRCSPSRRCSARAACSSPGLFFSSAALVTFGRAYAVLAYVAQRAVEVYGWLAPGKMVCGLALAETTLGPLIMVVQFVAFVGAYPQPWNARP